MERPFSRRSAPLPTDGGQRGKAPLLFVAAHYLNDELERGAPELVEVADLYKIVLLEQRLRVAHHPVAFDKSGIGRAQ